MAHHMPLPRARHHRSTPGSSIFCSVPHLVQRDSSMELDVCFVMKLLSQCVVGHRYCASARCYLPGPPGNLLSAEVEPIDWCSRSAEGVASARTQPCVRVLTGSGGDVSDDYRTTTTESSNKADRKHFKHIIAIVDNNTQSK